ncbi:MAG: hypothetical protein IKC15_05990 [Kiritimatiellae bacterium]|nr:hypothetical protein [Kiritimatiellia bacterium]
MADSNKVDVNFSAETAKASGEVRNFKGEIEATGPTGKKTAASISGSFKTIETAIGRVRKIMSTVSFATLWLNAIVDIVGKFNDWRNAAEKAAEKTRELQKAAADKAAAESVREIAEAYKELSRAISDVAEKRSRQNEITNEKVRIMREAEDAEMDAQEAEELADVDPDSEYADMDRAKIRDKYAAKRALRSADRKKTDIVMRRGELAQQAEDATAAADKIEESLAADDEAISRTRRKANTLEALSKERNDKDGTWYNPRKRTEEGDEERNRQREEAEKLRDEVKRLEKAKAEKERQVAELRAKATHAQEMHAELGTAIGTADVRYETARVRGETSREVTAAAERKEDEKAAAEAAAKAEKEAAEAAAKASALAAIPQLSAERDRVKAQIQAEQEKKDAANLAVYQAQGSYDAAKLGGNRREQQSAFSGLQSAQNAAQDVNHATDTAINAMTATLKSIESRLKAAQNFLEKQSGQERYAWSEAPAGA